MKKFFPNKPKAPKQEAFKPEPPQNPQGPNPSPLLSAFVAVSVIGATVAFIGVGLQHGAEGYEARKAEEKRKRDIAKKREQNNKRPR